MISPILNAGWGQLGISIFTWHTAAVPPIPPSPCVPGLFEGLAPMGWPVGFLSHKKEPSILVDGYPGIKQGHDIGFGIPHFATPFNAMCVIHILLSSHKVQVPVSRVIFKDTPAGAYPFYLLGQICCDPVNMPLGMVVPLICTVETTVSIWDVAEGFGYMALDVALGFLIGKLMGFLGGKWIFKKVGDKIKGLSLGRKLVHSILYKSLAKKLKGLSIGRQIFYRTGKSITRHVLNEMPSKMTKHILKSWVIKPCILGLKKGEVKIGPPSYRVKVFDKKWW